MPSAVRLSQRRRILLGSAIAAVCVAVTVLTTSLVLLSPSRLKARAERQLSSRLGLEVTIESLRVSFFPQARISGTRALFLLPGRPDLPPFVSVDHFWVDVGPLSAIRGHVETLHVGGLRIAVPPRDDSPEAEGRADPRAGVGDVIVDHLETDDAVLTIIRRDRRRPPLEFKIHALSVEDVGFDRVMPFSTRLTNPVPVGQVVTTGTVGPWVRGDPGALPLAGRYEFSLANLDTIKGIGGTLTSSGTYEGRLTEIRVEGHTATPDFNLDAGGTPVPLTTTFKAVVDGSDGTTRLERVDAMLFQTAIRLTGVVENLPGPGRHAVDLEMTSTGRIEDLLRLAIDAPTPMLSGDVSLSGRVGLQPGTRPVRDRVTVDGRLELTRATFADRGVQAKVEELSQRGSTGQDAVSPGVMTRLRGRVALSSGVMRMSGVTFAVPGATVALDGRYALASTRLDFVGILKMDASLSKAVGGVTSIFVKPFDWIFRRDGAGAVVPIRITGTAADPKVGLRVGRVFRPNDKQ